MLENLDKIDWSNLGHAYGPAEDVPDLLRSLASADEDERSNAIHDLCGNIWHQGTVYQATAYAVPFLLELLESPEVGGKDDILVLLAHLARGTSYHDVHQHLSHHKEEAKEQEWQDKIQKELGWVGDVKAAVKAGENLYLGFLNDADERLRDAAAYLLATLGTSARLAEAVWKRLEKENVEQVRVSLMLAFGMLAEHTEGNTSSLLAMLINSRSVSERLAAAMALVQLSPAEQSEDSIMVLLVAARAPVDFPGFGESIWGKVDGVESLVSEHLIRLEGNAARVAESMLTCVLPPSRPPAGAVRTAEILLLIAFRHPTQGVRTFDSLNEMQLRVLKLIADRQNVWVEQIGKGGKGRPKISMALRSWRLPEEQERLRAFVSGVAMPPPVGVEQKRTGISDRLKNFFGRGGR